MYEYVIKVDKFWNYRPLLWGVFLFFFFFFVWAGTTEIDQHVRGYGRVVPAGRIRTVQHLEGGIIKDILVREGDKVEADQVLFRLASTRAKAEMSEIDIALKSMYIRLARLDAEINDHETINFDRELIEKFPEMVDSETKLFLTRKAEIKERLDGLQKRMKQKVLKLDELEETAKNLIKERKAASEQLSIKHGLRQSGAISRSQYLEAESRVLDFDTRVAKVEKEIPIIKTELAEIVNLLEETRQNWKSRVNEERGEVKVEIEKYNERLRSYTDAFDRTEIVAPIMGIINRVSVNTIGGVVQAGQALAEIIPIEETLVVEGRISTNDRGKVWPGLDAVAKITAYDFTVYGGISGKLTYISPDSFIDNHNQEYYKIRVMLDRAKVGLEKPVYPGMTVDINIMAGKITILHSLLRPLWDVQENALKEL